MEEKEKHRSKKSCSKILIDTLCFHLRFNSPRNLKFFITHRCHFSFGGGGHIKLLMSITPIQLTPEAWGYHCDTRDWLSLVDTPLAVLQCCRLCAAESCDWSVQCPDLAQTRDTTECGPGLGCTYSQSQQGRASTRAEHFVLNTTLVQQLHAPLQRAARTT